MALIDVLVGAVKMNQLGVQAGRGNLTATEKSLRNLTTNDARLQSQFNRAGNQIKVGTVAGTGSSLNVTIGSNWTPAAVLMVRQLGSAIYYGDALVGDGKAVFIRTLAGAATGGGASMGVIATLGIYLQSNGFGLGSTLSVTSKSYGYIAFRSGPTDA